MFLTNIINTAGQKNISSANQLLVTTGYYRGNAGSQLGWGANWTSSDP